MRTFPPRAAALPAAVAAAAAATLALLPSRAAHAQFPAYSAFLDASQEVATVANPAVPSNGTGTGFLQILDLVGADGVADTMRISLAATRLNAAPSDAHIHFGAPGVNGGVVVPLFSLSGAGIAQNAGGGDAVSGFTYTFIGDVSAATTGIAGNQGAVDNFNLTLGRLLAGNTNHYFNVHTPLPAGRPAGEVRGNFVATVPEAGTAGLLGAAGLPLLLCARACRRRRRRA